MNVAIQMICLAVIFTFSAAVIGLLLGKYLN